MSPPRTPIAVLLAALLCALCTPAAAKGAKKKAAAPPPPPPPAELPIAPLVAPPIEEKTIVATPVDAAPAVPAAQIAAPAAEPAPTTARALFQLGPRAGLYVPRGALSLGPLAGVELGYVLPLSELHPAIDRRFTLIAAASWVETGLAEPALVPGRGLDAGFTQRSALVPLEAALRYRLPLPDDLGLEVAAEAGFGLFGTWTTFRSFSTTTQQQDFAPGFVGALQAELPLGPGRALLRVSDFEASAELGPLGPAAASTGEPSFAGLAVALGFVFPLGT